MAVMWPKILPPDVVNNTLRSTECKVFKQLESTLNNAFVVFYSRPWLGLKPDGEEIDGECDFIVAHAKLGFLTLEVKGGAIAYDPRSDQWTSRDRWQVTHNIKNPVQQAKSAKHQFLKKLKDYAPNLKTRRIWARYGVIFPHSLAPKGYLGADIPQGILCGLEEFENGFRDWIIKRFGDVPEDKALGADGLKALEGILAKPFQLHTPLGTLLSHDDNALQMLTQQQFHILRGIEEIPRVAISGGAGTGKTVLAVEEARRCAESGARTLFICYNRGLANDIGHRLRDIPRITVSTFHQLCTELGRRAQVPWPSEKEHASDKELFGEIYPERLMQAFERLPKRTYDAIIVDEGQDFWPLWWTALEAGLDPNGRQIMRVFYDSNQQVYSKADHIPKDVNSVPFRLDQNLRNTRRIHELVRQYYIGYEIEAVGPEGTAVEWIKADNQQVLGRHISKYITRLKNAEQVPEGDIAVLGSTPKGIRELKDNHLGAFDTASCDDAIDPSESRPNQHNKIIVDTVRRFKGLERPVVIIAATPDIVEDTYYHDHIDLLYVALSRARTHLAIVGEDRVLSRLQRGT